MRNDYDLADVKQWTEADIIKYAIEEGFKEGLKEERQAFARKRLKRNRPIEEIMEDTGLTLEEISKIS